MRDETQLETQQNEPLERQPEGADVQERGEVSSETAPIRGLESLAWLDDARYKRPDPIIVKSITVRKGRIIFDVVISDPAFRTTTPKLAAFATRQYPDLPLHACVNSAGNAFGSVIESTSVPHLLEHLAIDVQTRNATGSDDTVVGTTEWIDERSGKARVEMSFKDDLEALKAFNEATRFLNTAVLTCLS